MDSARCKVGVASDRAIKHMPFILKGESTMALIICSFCGKTTSDWNDKCPFCGANLTGEETKIIDSTAQELQDEIVDENDIVDEEAIETVIEQEEEAVVKFCGSCGRELVKGASFCPFCGKAISEQFCDAVNSKTTKQQTVQPDQNGRQPSSKPSPTIQKAPSSLVVPTPPPVPPLNGAPVYQQPPRTIVVQQYVPTPQVVYQTVEEKPKKKTGCGTWFLSFLLLGIIFVILIPAYKSYTKKQEAEQLSTNKADYRTNITYEDLARKPDQYKGTLVCFKGRVVQVLDSSSNVTIRLATKNEQYFGYQGDVLYCTISKDFLNGGRLLEDDIITIYGKADGIKEYTAILGNTIQIPSVVVRIVDIEKK